MHVAGCARCLLLLPLSFIAAGSALVTAAQAPIRVETNQVLVPAVVLDKDVYALMDREIARRRRISEDSPLLQSLAIRGLTAKDFRLFEDGREQRIESVRLEAPVFSMVRDNKGKHPEIMGGGGGRWAYPDRPGTDPTIWLSLPQYVIAYVPQASRAGSCHQIKVKVGRTQAIVWARSEYCNTKHPPSDPLKGTEFSKRMEEDLSSAKQSQVDLKLQGVAFYPDAGAARLNIELEFPGKTLKHEFRHGTLYASIGVLIMVYDKDGTLVARSSEFACCDYGNGIGAPSNTRTDSGHSSPYASIIPDRYETQMELSPGEYELRAILSDGEKFGRAQMPLKVESHNEKELALSEIALARRIRVMPAGALDGEAGMSGRYRPLVSKGIEFTPTANARFEKKEMLYAYFEIYEPPPTQPPPRIEAHIRVLDAKTGDVKIDFEPVNAAPYIKAESPVISMGRGVDLSSLPDGSYRLEVQATDATGKSSGWHAANFMIEAPATSSGNKEAPVPPGRMGAGQAAALP